MFDLAPYPGAPPGGLRRSHQAERVPSAFANDLPAKKAAVRRRRSARVRSAPAPSRPVRPPGRRSPPGTWSAISTTSSRPPRSVHGQRAQAHTMEIAASHLSMIRQRRKATQIIEAAAHSAQEDRHLLLRGRLVGRAWRQPSCRSGSSAASQDSQRRMNKTQEPAGLPACFRFLDRWCSGRKNHHQHPHRR